MKIAGIAWLTTTWADIDVCTAKRDSGRCRARCVEYADMKQSQVMMKQPKKETSTRQSPRSGQAVPTTPETRTTRGKPRQCNIQCFKHARLEDPTRSARSLQMLFDKDAGPDKFLNHWGPWCSRKASPRRRRVQTKTTYTSGTKGSTLTRWQLG